MQEHAVEMAYTPPPGEGFSLPPSPLPGALASPQPPFGPANKESSSVTPESSTSPATSPATAGVARRIGGGDRGAAVSLREAATAVAALEGVVSVTGVSTPAGIGKGKGKRKETEATAGRGVTTGGHVEAVTVEGRHGGDRDGVLSPEGGRGLELSRHVAEEGRKALLRKTPPDSADGM